MNLRGEAFYRLLKSGKRIKVSGRVLKGAENTANQFGKLVQETVEQKALPRKKNLLKLLGAISKDFVQNPVAAIKAGNAREATVRALLKTKGIDASRKVALQRLLKEGKKVATSDDMITNIGGTVGGTAGKLIPIPGAGLAGDLGGALATRRALTDTKILKTVSQHPEWKGASIKKRLQLITQQRTALKAKVKDDFVGDTSGFLIGNTGTRLSPTNIPFEGGIPALATVPAVVRASNRIAKGKNAIRAIKDELARPLRQEKVVRRKIDRYIKEKLS